VPEASFLQGKPEPAPRGGAGAVLAARANYMRLPAILKSSQWMRPQSQHCSRKLRMRGRVYSPAERTQRACSRIACSSSPLAKV
jgi:hypothetical protein